MLLFTSVTLYPFVTGFVFSFTDKSPLVRDTHWVGLENYSKLLFEDALFLGSLANTLWYAVLLVPAQSVLGLVGALYVNRKLWGHQLTRLALFAPFVLSVAVVGIVWGWILETRYGLLNLGLAAIGGPATTP